MKVLVTGGYGLVGNSLQKVIKNFDNTHEFVFLSRKDGDLVDVNAVNALFINYRPDIVIHLASCVGGVYDNMAKNYDYLVNNLRINTNIVEACNKFGVKKLISCLSTCIFPNEGIKYPITSDQLHLGLPHESNIGYAYSKRVLQLTGSLLAKRGNVKVINVTPTNLYGEYDNYNIKSSHVIPGLIHKTYIAKETSKDLQVYGSGKSLRQFLYVDDLSRVILNFIDYDSEENEISCIVAPPENDEVSIKTLIDKIVELSDFKGNVIYDTSYSDGQYKKTATHKELLHYFPDFTFTKLESGLSEVINYFNNNYDNIRK